MSHTNQNNSAIDVPEGYRVDYLSGDRTSALSSHGIFFKVGDFVTHDGSESSGRRQIVEFFTKADTYLQIDVYAVCADENGETKNARIAFLSKVN